jgi:hypothetical protein
VVISERLWRRRGSHPGIIGRTLRIHGDVRVIGVVPQDVHRHVARLAAGRVVSLPGTGRESGAEPARPEANGSMAADDRRAEARGVDDLPKARPTVGTVFSELRRAEVDFGHHEPSDERRTGAW